MTGSYHPDPHGIFDLDPAFDTFHEQVAVPDTLAIFFENIISANSLGLTEEELIVRLVEAYGELVERIPEVSVQLALRQAAPNYYHPTLAYAMRRDLTQKEKHGLSELI